MRCVNLFFVCASLALMLGCSARLSAPTQAESAPASEPKPIPSVPTEELRKTEYSLRWRPLKSLATADDVAKWLAAHAQLSADPQAEPVVDVRYFTLARSVPERLSARSILRRRGDGSWTYKVRSTDGSVPPREEALAGCENAAIEGEWDISLDSSGSVAKRTASLSCDGEGTTSKPGSLASLTSTKARPCIIRMERTRIPWSGHKEIKIEHWTFRPSRTAPATELLEVSWKGKTKSEEGDAFRQLIQGMPIGEGDRPPSKEELAEACDALS
jgi:hypothetical protein